MAFSVTGFVSTSSGAGLVVPIFKMESSNMPFIQEMAQYYDIVGMLPFFTAEHYDIVSEDVPNTSVRIGDQGLIAFRSFDRKIHLLTLKELFEFRDTFIHELQATPLLNLQIARACGVPAGELHRLWNAVADQYLDEGNRKIWVDSELRLNQKESRIWKQISDETSNDIEFDEIGKEPNFDKLFAWLNRNKLSPRWASIWTKAFLQRRFDEQLMQLGMQWLESRLADNTSVREIKPILYMFLESTRYDDLDDEFKKLKREYIMSKSDEFYDFYFPKDFLFHLVRNSYFDDAELEGNFEDSDFVEFLSQKIGHNEQLADEVEKALVLTVEQVTLRKFS